MKLTDLFDEKNIQPNLSSTDKLGVLKELVDLISQQQPELDRDGVLRILLEREKLGSTGTGAGVAIPHGKVESISELLVCFGKSLQGVDFESIDDQPAHLFFLLVAPTNSIGTHLSALARISNLLNDDAIREKLMKVDDAGALYRIIESFDRNEPMGE